jgi:hypothetical protein
VTAARRARQKARRQQDSQPAAVPDQDLPDSPDVTVQAGVASAAVAPAGEQEKD